MSTELWRQAAHELLPMFRDHVDNAESVGMLWIDLWSDVEDIHAERLSEKAISSLFRYGSWCLLSDDEECQNAAIVNFYEELPTNVRLRRNLHSYLSVEDFLGLKELFDHNLSKAEHERFIEEFLEKANQGKEAGAPIEGEASQLLAPDSPGAQRSSVEVPEDVVTIDDWSQWTDDQVLGRHQCSGNLNKEVGVLRRGESEAGPPGWILAIIEAATEDDVSKGVAPQLGVPSRCTALEIRFCPFCGTVLGAS